jgi:6-phosphogluconolactonase (cycloisomerase 2 family)/urocanate hydratase
MLGCATLLAGCSQSDCLPTTLTSGAKLVSLWIGPPDGSLAKGTTQQYVVTGIYSDGTRADLSSQVTLSSSAASIAAVSNASGSASLVTAVAPGSTTLTATLDGVSGSTDVTVSAATLVSIGVTSATADLPLGLTEPFTAIGVYSDHTTQDLTDTVTWSSTTGGVATISNGSGTNGLAKAATTGATTITASFNGVTGSKGLTVTPAVLESIEVTVASAGIGAGLAAGLNEQFVATGIYSDGTKHDLTSQVTWTSATAKVGSITSGGLASGLAAGSTVLTAALGNVSATQTLNVTPATLVSIGVTPTNTSAPVGLRTQFTATGVYSDGTTKDLTSQMIWSSANTQVAPVSNAAGYTGLATALGTGTTTVSATVNGVTGSSVFTVTAATLLSIDLSPANPSIANGTTQNLTATGIYSDGSRANLTSTVAWTSSNGGVASISNAPGSNGQAIAATPGTTTITAATGTVSASTGLTVTPATLVSIAVTPANPSIANGTSEPFVATGTFSDHTTQNLTTAVTWSSGAGTVASISNAAGSNGLATAAGTGSTTITAALGAVSGSTPLTVTAATLKSITVTPAAATIPDGTSEQYVATGIYSDNSTQNLTSSVVWTSSTPAAASISNAAGSSGLATGAGVGSTMIEAQLGSVTGSTSLAVTNATLVSIAVTPAGPTIAKGTTEQFVATGTYSDHSTQNLTTTVAWTSGTPAVATISNAAGSDGLASSATQGATTITATAGSVTGSTTLNVTAATLVSMAVTPTNPSIAAGTAQQFTAVGTYSDNSTQDLTASATWSSSTTSVASISNASGSQGMASSTDQGSTTIAASLGGISGSSTLTVTTAKLVSIAVTPVDPNIAVATTNQFTATGTYSDGSTHDLTSSVTWSSGTPAVASISNAAGSNGRASAATQGSTAISATLGGIVGSTTLTVNQATLVSIAVTPANQSIANGTGQQYTATGTYTDGSTQNLTSAVAWASSAPGVASISNASGSQGLASSAALGSTTITATLGSIAGSTPLTVTAATLTSITVTPANATVIVGATQQYVATGRYTDGSTQVLTTSVTWSSSNSGDATVSNAPGSNGLATGIVAGTVTITATAAPSSTSGSTGLTVTPQYAYVINNGANTIAQYSIGANGALTATGTPLATGSEPFFEVVNATNQYLYEVNINDNTIGQYSIGAGGALTPIGSGFVATGANPAQPVIDYSGQYLYVQNVGDSSVSEYSIGGNGALTSIGSIATGTTPFGIGIEPSNHYLYVPNNDDGNAGTISEYSIGAGGVLTALNPAKIVADASSPGLDKIAFEPTGKYAYVTNSTLNEVEEFSIGPNGQLTKFGTVAAGSYSRSIVLDQSGTYVYVVNSNDATISEYSIGSAGALTPLNPATVSIGSGSSSYDITLDATGRFVYVPVEGNNTVVQFSIGANGVLTLIGSIGTGSGTAPSGVATTH